MPKRLSDLRPHKLGVKRYSQVANAVANHHGVFFAQHPPNSGSSNARRFHAIFPPSVNARY
jgi:hypothetical protein